MRYLAATDEGVFTLEQNGSNWKRTGAALEDQHVTSVGTRHGLALVGSREGVYRLEEGGNWRPATQGLTVPYVRWLVCHRDQPGRALAGTQPANIFVTSDRGRTWHGSPKIERLREAGGWFLPYAPEPGCVRGFALHGHRAYAAVEQGGVLRSDDDGESWRLCDGCTGTTEDKGPPVVHPDVHSITVHPSSPDLVLAPCGGGFYRSHDGGKRWELLYKCYVRAVWVQPDDANHMILGPADGVTENGRIEETCDGGRSWADAAAGLDTPWPENMVDRFVQAGNQLLAVTFRGRLLVTELDELEWRNVPAELPPVNAVALLP